MKGCKPLSETEIARVEKTINQGVFGARNFLLFVLGRLTGLRISELLSLRIKDVWQYSKPVSRVSVERKNTKKKVEGKTIVLNEVAKNAIEGYVKSLGLVNGEDFLFKSRKGYNCHITKIQAYRIIKQAADSAKVSGKIGTHTMRKTFANQVYQKLGRDLAKTQKALCHKNIASTVCYLSVDDAEIEQAILAL